MSRLLRPLPIACASAALSACVPSFDDSSWLVNTARIVAIRATPAEAKENQNVEFEALIVAPPGAAAASASYQLCVDRKPLTELGSVSPSCLVPGGNPASAVVPLGHAGSANAELPSDACRLFGPLRPEPKPGEPAARPLDPDVTGGFYQPVVAWLGPAQLVVGDVRLSCGLAGAGESAQLDFAARYRPNENPELSALELVRSDGSTLALDGDRFRGALNRGETASLRATWPACPRVSVCGDGVCGEREDSVGCSADCQVPKGCAGAETYAYYDASTQAVVDRRESILVAWYASAGKLGSAETGRTEQEPDGVDTSVAFSAPEVASDVRLWAVVRDDRGGVGWLTGSVAIGGD